MDIFSIILILAAAHGFFLVTIIINNVTQKRPGLIFLIILTLAFSMDLFHEFLVRTEYIRSLPFLRYTDPLVNLLYGPALFLYVNSLTAKSYKIKSFKVISQFLMFFVSIAVITTFPHISDSQFLALFHHDIQAKSDNEYEVLGKVGSIATLSVLSLGIYLMGSFYLLYKHSKRIKSEFSSTKKISLLWLKVLITNILIMYLILILGGYFTQLFPRINDSIYVTENLNQFLYLMIAACIYAMGYFGLKQPSIFIKSDKKENQVSKKTTNSKDKYYSSSLDALLSKELKTTLHTHMEKDKPFLINQLSLSQLAEQLELPPNYLSQVVNQNFEMNFFDFINQYRVEYAKQQISEITCSQRSILSIAFDSGFNSKSAFYSAFKKHTGLTPSQYKKNLDNENKG